MFPATDILGAGVLDTQQRGAPKAHAAVRPRTSAGTIRVPDA